MKTKNIVFILPSLAGGGAEKVIISLIENIDNSYYKPTLIVQNKSGPLKTKINKKNIIDLKYNNFRYAIPKLIKTIIIVKPDIIISTFPHITLPLIILKYLFYKKTKIIARVPNMVNLSLSHSPYSKLLKLLHRIFMLRANKIIVTSKSMQNDLIARGIKKERLFLIHNPLDKNSIRNVRDLNRFPGIGLRLVIVGRLTYQKGIDRVIPIISKINNCHLTIIGDGKDEKKLKNMVSNLAIEDKVKFIGFSYYANSYIAAADYLLLPSRWEGLPNIALESLILGTPVISFKEIVGLNDFEYEISLGSIRLCKEDAEMEYILNILKPRKDYLKPIIRNSLLKNFNSPKTYAKKIEIMIKGLIGAK